MKNNVFELVYRAMCEYDTANKPDDLVRIQLLLVMNGLVCRGVVSNYKFDLFPSEITIDYSNNVPRSNKIRMFRKELTKENAVIYDVHES